MKLELIKNPSNGLRILMGLVFCSAGLFRLVVPQLALDEMAALGLPALLFFPIAAFEIATGILLLVNRYVKYVSIALVIFLFLALIKGLIIGGQGLWTSASELFVFNTTPTDIFMHFVFLIILLFLFLSALPKNSENMPSDTQKN